MPKAQPNRVTFNKTTLAALQTPARGRAYHYDTKTPGLCLCVTAAGARTFYVYRWSNGKPERLRLGKFPDLSVEQARSLCKAIVGDLAAGKDPIGERRAARREPTLGELWAHWEQHAKGRKRESSLSEDRRLWERFLKPWESRRLSSIRRPDVARLHTETGAAGEKQPKATAERRGGRYIANRLLSLLRAMFNRAGDIGYSGENPAAKIKPFPEEQRDRFLTSEELPRFFKALSEEPNPILQAFFSLCLLTGSRRGSLQAMRWADVSFDLALWQIPASDAKGKQPVVVPLVPLAVEILRKLRELVPASSEWVFPGRRGGHLTTPNIAWKRLCQRAGLENLRIHDLRRSVGSWMAMGGSGLPIIGKLLGHRQASTTQIYARLQTDPVRAALTHATDAMLAHDLPAAQDEHGGGDAAPTADTQ